MYRKAGRSPTNRRRDFPGDDVADVTEASSYSVPRSRSTVGHTEVVVMSRVRNDELMTVDRRELRRAGGGWHH